MKPMIAAALLFAAPLAYAENPMPRGVPDAIVCTAPAARSPDARKFEITKLNEETPETTLREGFQESRIEGNKYVISFSDECEGWYATTFKLRDLRQLGKGRVTSIAGELEYDDLAEFFPDVPVDIDDNQHDLVKITCVLK